VDAEFLVNTLGARVVAVVYNDDPYGKAWAIVGRRSTRFGRRVAVRLQVAVEHPTLTSRFRRSSAAQPDCLSFMPATSRSTLRCVRRWSRQE